MTQPKTKLVSLALASIVGFVVWLALNKPGSFSTKVQDLVLPSALSFSGHAETKLPPTQISFPTLNKQIVVPAALIYNGHWQTFPDKAAWLATSGFPGEGNVVIYAHNRKQLFGDINQLRVGDLIHLTAGNQTHPYKVSELISILPTNLDAILTESHQLTLYTCEGFFDQKRFMVIALPL